MLAVVCASCAGIVLSAAAYQAPDPQAPRLFRSQSELVLLPVTARDVQGHVVRDILA